MPRSFQSGGGVRAGITSASNFLPNYTTPVAAFGTPWVGYGMNSRYSTAADVHGQEIYLPLTLTDAVGPQTVIGSSARVDVQGTPAGSGSIIGNLAYVFTNSFSNSNQTLYGNFTQVDIGGPVKQAYGGYFSSAIGSVGAGTTTDLAVGVYGSAGASYNQAAVELAIGGDFRVSSSQSIGGVTVPLAMGTRIRANMSTDTTFTDLRGISLNDWTTSGGGTATTSYGIYADSSIDIGATRYFIYSLSTSPCYFTGKHTFDVTNTTGGTTGNQTINKPSFSVNFAAGASSLVVTNSFITANSHVFCVVQTNDSTALIKNVTPAAGSVTIRLNAAATAETRVACFVIN